MAYGGGSFRRGGFRRFNGPREMHKITCSDCGKDGEVPFKPKEGLPVYCKECFMKKKDIASKRPTSAKAADVEKEEIEESEGSEEEEY